MRILVLGSGGREHALVHALSKDPSVTELHVAPGNPGIARLATCHDADICDPAAVVSLAQEVAAELVVVGPEMPLVAGVTDAVRAAGIACFGPSQAAARLEGSKQFAKEVMGAAGVPTARAIQLLPGATPAEVQAALAEFGPDYVVKDDGLAGGKGVVVTRDYEEARRHVDAVHAAGNPVLIESFLAGPEVSLFCLVDGETVVPLLPAQDHKRAFDGDTGPNTGGMGAYTPLPWLPDGAVERIVEEIARPVATEMTRRDTPYQGLLYVGAVWSASGPEVIEFNARFGDPETQAILSLLQTPLAGLLYATATGGLHEASPLEWSEEAAVTVVLAAEGYPSSPVKGTPIFGEHLFDPEVILHAGTARDEQGQLVVGGGRVLNVLGRGRTLAEAREQAYARVKGISIEGSFYRTDIGAKEIVL